MWNRKGCNSEANRDPPIWANLEMRVEMVLQEKLLAAKFALVIFLSRMNLK